MNILVYANCQAQQLVMGLSMMYMEKARVFGIDINDPQASNKLQEMAKAGNGAGVDFVVTNQVSDELTSKFAGDKLIVVPSMDFGGFHPDVVYFASTQTPSKPAFFKRNPTISALALWGHLHRIPPQKVLEWYREDVFEALGYMDYFDVCCHAILQSFAQHQMDSQLIERFIASREVFMYGPFHPKLEVTLSLCEGICDRMQVKPKVSREQLDHLLPDPLQHEYAWGCYPPLAARLGVPGSWLVRHYNEVFPTMAFYLQTVYAFLDSLPRGSIQFFDKDKTRFEEFHKINDVLGRLV